MKRKQSLLTLLLILLLAGAVRLLLTADRAAEAVREDLSSHILRFHVLANSDSEEDQALKLSVKEAVLSYLEEALPAEADLEATKAFIASHEDELRCVSLSVIRGAGYSYDVTILLEPWYFPQKHTGSDLSLRYLRRPAHPDRRGRGQELVVRPLPLPLLCGRTCAVVPEDSRNQLKTVLDEDTYGTLEGKRAPDPFPTLRLISGLF